MFRSCQFSPLASYRLGEAFSEIKEKTGVEHYNVRMIVNLTKKEGEEDKEVIIGSHSVSPHYINCLVQAQEFVEHGVLYEGGTRCLTKGDRLLISLLFNSQEFISRNDGSS